MGYIQAVFFVMILCLVITRILFPGQISAFLRRQSPLITHPHIHAFIYRHSRLLAYILSNLGLFPLIPPSRPPSLDSSPLSRLAPEIIQQISSFLPASSAASFASTCLPIRLITGTQYMSTLRTSSSERIALLEFLAADLPLEPNTTVPPRLLCLYCKRLVASTNPCITGATRACTEARDLITPYVSSIFSLQVFHTAMAQHRHGRSPYALLSTLKPPTTTMVRHGTGVTIQKAWEYRILYDSLFQRKRVSMVLPRSEYDCNYVLKVQPCAHYASYQELMDEHAAHMQDTVRGRAGVRACSDLIMCRQCRTALRVGARRFRGLGLGLFVTSWRDLGDGRPVGGNGVAGWKDVVYSVSAALILFENMCHGQRYFDFEGLDTVKDRKELLATARSVVKE